MTASDPWHELRRWTSARIALGRTGDGLPTARVLEFQLAHAKARDAVHLPLDTPRLMVELAAFKPVAVESRADNRSEYLQRPDLGRQLHPRSFEILPEGRYDAAVVVADGLSALAVHENAPALVERLHALAPKLTWAPVVVAVQGRVALGDDIAAALGAALVVVLLGERPGLTAVDSLGAYLTWRPRPGLSRDAERNCVSNIRPHGLSTDDAARRIVALMTMARHSNVSGVGLKEDEAFAFLQKQERHPAVELRRPDAQGR